MGTCMCCMEKENENDNTIKKVVEKLNGNMKVSCDNTHIIIFKEEENGRTVMIFNKENGELIDEMKTLKPAFLLKSRTNYIDVI